MTSVVQRFDAGTRWPTVTLGDVLTPTPRPVDVVSDRTYREIGIRSHGKGIFHKEPVTGLELGSKNVFWVEPGDFVLNIVFAWEGAVAVLGPEEAGMIGSHRFPTFRADPARLDARYLLAYFRTPAGLDLLGRVSPGGAGRNRTLSRTAFLRQKVPLPDLRIQRQIISRFETVASRLAEATSLRSETLAAAVALVAATRSVLLGDRVQADWVPLAHYIDVIENGKSPSTDGRPASGEEWGVLKVGAVSFGFYDDRENKALPITFSPLPQYEVTSGDFLMLRANTPDLVGACAIVDRTRPHLMLSDKTFRLVPKAETDGLCIRYLDQALKSPVLRDQIRKSATGTSPTMKNISKEKVLGLRVPRHTRSMQERIVSQLALLLDKTSAVQSELAGSSAQLSVLLPSFLDRTFRGA